MEARRQLIRYAITGGYALMIAAFYEAVFGWAWKESVEGLIPTTKADAFTTIGGAVAVGFVLYQLYSALERPRPDLSLKLAVPRWLPLAGRRLSRALTLRMRIPSFNETDPSSNVLDALHEIPAVQQALQHAYRCAGTEKRESEAALEQDANVLNSVLNLTYSSGDGQIARSYAALEDLYHALGACHAALVAISVATALDILAAHGEAYLDHLWPSLAVTLLVLLLIWGSHAVLKVNRRRRRQAMTNQLSNDLRAWALRHPQLLRQLAERSEEE
jgi:hypothetical protein